MVKPSLRFKQLCEILYGQYLKQPYELKTKHLKWLIGVGSPQSDSRWGGAQLDH